MKKEQRVVEITAGGHGEVIALLERYLIDAKANPRYGYASLVLIEEGTDRACGACAGDVALESRAERATISMSENIRERGINRILPPRDPSMPANYAVYNVPAGSICYDFLVWLIDAEMQRQMEGAPAPLRVCFWFGRNGTDGLYLESQRQMFEHVVKPSLALVGAIEDPEAVNGRAYTLRHLSRITEAAQIGHAVPKFRPVIPWGLRNYITITLREADHWSHRNSDIDAWMRFACDLEQRGERVIFVRDTAKANQSLGQFETYPSASLDLRVRMSLYAHAKANLFVSNGPCILAAFSERPWLCFTPPEPDGSAYVANTPLFWRQNVGIEIGDQYPWSAPNQRLVWAPDTYENICAAWEGHFCNNRLELLKHEQRCVGGGPVSSINGVAGLVDLINYAKPKSVIEIGCNQGVSTEAFLLHCERVVAVDPWPGEEVFQHFMARCGKYPGLEPIRHISPDAQLRFRDREFDLCYIDAIHEYNCVVTDIRACRRVVNKWIAGHDFNIPAVAAAVRAELGEPDRIFSDASWLKAA